MPDLNNGYFPTMTYMIVSHTHNYDLVANIKLILHVKKSCSKMCAYIRNTFQ